MADIVQSIPDPIPGHQQYTVFESDQVLAADQLNSVTDYLNYQERMTRVQLLGVGIISGLQVTLRDGEVLVRQGVGVTTDGDLMLQPTDKFYGRVKDYDASRPRYDRLFRDGNLIAAFQLTDESDPSPNARPLETLSSDLPNMTVVMLMESCRKDVDRCTSTHCDSLGQLAIDTPILLLVSRNDAKRLLPSTEPNPDVVNVKRILPELKVERLDVKQMSNAFNILSLAALYRKVCNAAHALLLENMELPWKHFNEIVQDVFPEDPSQRWTADLKAINGDFAGATLQGTIQIYYDFLKDLVETWNDLRTVLLDIDSVSSSSHEAFPKHLVLGALGGSLQLRTGIFPSSLVAGSTQDRELLERARFLVRKFDALIRNYDPSIAGIPGDSLFGIRVSPSRNECTSLDERAIPYYYDLKSLLPNWNMRLTKRGVPQENFGYWMLLLDTVNFTREQLAGQIGRHDFFRIEGHLTRNISDVQKSLDETIRTQNLPFTVRSVLLHTTRDKIIGRPDRFTDLHRFHYILRKDLASQLTDTQEFNKQFEEMTNAAIKDIIIKREDIKEQGQLSLHDTVKSSIDAVAKPLQTATYSSYLQQRGESLNFRQNFEKVVDSATNIKVGRGNVVRTDVTTAFDSLIISKHPAWLNWMDQLIEAKNEHEDNRLLFSKFCEEHPGLEHLGGVARGGTFVLVYDDTGKVVADFALPYHWPETSEVEPQTPVDLQLPPPKIPVSGGIKFTPVFERDFETKFETKFDPIKKKLEVDRSDLIDRVQLQVRGDYMKLFNESLVVFNKTTINKSPVVVDRAVQDENLKPFLKDIDDKRVRVENLRDLIVNPSITDPIRDLTRAELDRAEIELGNSIAAGTEFVVRKNIDTTTDGVAALSVISEGLDKIRTPQTHDALKNISVRLNITDVATPTGRALRLRGL